MREPNVGLSPSRNRQDERRSRSNSRSSGGQICQWSRKMYMDAGHDVRYDVRLATGALLTVRALRHATHVVGDAVFVRYCGAGAIACATDPR